MKEVNEYFDLSKCYEAETTKEKELLDHVCDIFDELGLYYQYTDVGARSQFWIRSSSIDDFNLSKAIIEKLMDN